MQNIILELESFRAELRESLKRLKGSAQDRGVPPYAIVKAFISLVEMELQKEGLSYELTQDFSMAQVNVTTDMGTHTISLVNLNAWEELARLREFIRECKRLKASA